MKGLRAFNHQNPFMLSVEVMAEECGCEYVCVGVGERHELISSVLVCLGVELACEM